MLDAVYTTFLLCFFPRTFFFEQQIGQFTLGLLYIRFTYYSTDYQQECSILSNWFSLRCLGPWINHLPRVWWSTFRLMVLNWQLMCKFCIVGRNFLLISCLYWCLYTLLKFCFLLLWNSILILSTLFCARINGWLNNREVGDLRRQRDHYDVSVMNWALWRNTNTSKQ